MGKSTVAAYMSEHNIPVHDADACVHELFRSHQEVIGQVGALFPDVIEDGHVNRKTLSQHVFPNPDNMKQLEEIVHPRVRQDRNAFVKRHQAIGTPCVVLDIPLLFEANHDSICNAIVVIACDKENQEKRAMRRPGMTKERLQQINHLQMPIEEKMARADYVVRTDGEKEETYKQLDKILSELQQKHNFSLNEATYA